MELENGRSPSPPPHGETLPDNKANTEKQSQQMGQWGAGRHAGGRYTEY